MSGNCESCEKWLRSKPRDGKQSRHGTCMEPSRMVFFGAPEATNSDPNMYDTTWAWDSCDEFTAASASSHRETGE